MNSTVITFAGNLTADPGLHFTPAAGYPVAELRVAANRRVKDGDDWKDTPATFHPVKVWGKNTENLIESATKGDRVLVHGLIETEAWQGERSRRRSALFSLPLEAQGSR